jgi:hypothetical protein
MTASPTLLWRKRRRSFRRLVLLSALVGLFLLTPSAGGVPGDPTPPEITPTIVGTIGGAGWYRSNVTVNWAVVDPQSIILGTECALATTLTADTLGTRLTCRAWSDGGETTKSVTIKIDKTPPPASAAADRQPDANGWYNRLLTVTASGTDATSGIASCTSAQYAGPDNVSALVVGSCSDIAGNVTSTSYSFKYDATAPSITALTTKRGNRSVQVAWRKSTDTQVVEVQRAPGRNGQGETVVYRGAETGFRDTGLVIGRKYEYRVIGVDEAANRAEQKVEVVATGALLSPAPAERVTAPPNLIWTAVKGASYYNVQLIRGRKVLSAWPASPSFQLRRTWLYKGRRYRLRPGVYRWYVWPGYGRISAARYGRPLGSSTFVVSG